MSAMAAGVSYADLVLWILIQTLKSVPEKIKGASL
jgi:hypothetical protein